MITTTDKLCCYLSLLSYNSEHQLNTTLHKNFQHVNFHSSNIDAQCITTVSKQGVLYIAFRGSESTKDWLADLDIVRTRMDLPSISGKKRPKVHRGFLRQFRSLQEFINSDIVDYIYKGDPKTREIIVTGHSLGGALASLCALYFSLLYKNVRVSCYTYGSPRVGHTTFVSLFKKNVFDHGRFVNEDDPVTMIPLKLRFTHLPNVFYIDENDKVSKTKKSRWKSLFSSICKSDNPFLDHDCQHYYRKLMRN
jgi:predicted lipase